MAADAARLATGLELPTALLHLLAVELLPVFGFGVASWSAGTHFLAYELMANRYIGRLDPRLYGGEEGDLMFSTGSPSTTLAQWQQQARGAAGRPPALPPTLQDHVECVQKAVVEFMTTDNASSAFLCPGCGNQLECPKSVAPVGIPVLVYGALALTAVLLLWVLALFAAGGLCAHSCGSGAYLRFTWELELRPTYRVLVYLMLFATASTMALMLVIVLSSGDGRSLFSLAGMIFMDAVTLVICLWRLLVPRTGVHKWVDGEQLGHCQFRRTWFKLPRVFPESNDSFASKLVDALWQAKNGHTKFLRQLLQDPRDAEKLLVVFSQMPMEMLDDDS